MKKLFIIAGLALVAWVINAGQITAVTNTVKTVSIPPVKWEGAEAAIVAGQLLSITNADGSKVVTGNFFSGRSCVIIIKIDSNPTNGLKSITAEVR
jgi:hypothetical protein